MKPTQMLKLIHANRERVSENLKSIDIEELMDKLPKKPRDYSGDVEGFVASEYSTLDDQNMNILATIHRHICHLRKKDLAPNKTIARPGATDRITRRWEHDLNAGLH